MGMGSNAAALDFVTRAVPNGNNYFFRMVIKSKNTCRVFCSHSLRRCTARSYNF